MVSVASPATPTALSSSAGTVGRRWYQFSLRTLLIGMMLVSMGAGLLGIRVQRAERQRQATVSLGRIGGQMAYDSNDSIPLVVRDLAEPSLGRDFFDSVVAADVDLRHADTTGGHLAAWRHISNLPQLKRLAVDYPQRYPRSRFNIGPIRRLATRKSLKIRDAASADGDLLPLEKMPALERLDLSHSQVSDAAWRHVAVVPRLQAIDASYALVSDAGAAHLARCPDLRHLVLTRGTISDSGAAALAKIASLETLVLDGTRITDEALAHLAQLENLQSLSVSETAVTERGLDYLAASTSLNSVTAERTTVTQEALRRFADSRPAK